MYYVVPFGQVVDTTNHRRYSTIEEAGRHQGPAAGNASAMTLVQLDGKTYRVSPSGLVWAGYHRPSQPEQGSLWRSMSRSSPLSVRVRIAAGLEAAPVLPEPRPRDRHYSDRHHIKFRRRG